MQFQKKLKNKLFGLVLVFLIGLGSLSFIPYGNYFEIAKNLDIFATLYKEVNTYYVDEVDPESLINAGIEAMLSSLDPYTNYIPEEALDEYRTMTTGEYAGIGSLIGKVNGKNMITMPNRGFPAEKAGLKIGDELIAVDGIDVADKSTLDISKLLKGRAKTEVVVTVKRYGIEGSIDFTIIRGRIKIDNVPYYGLVNGNIGYVRLSDFTTNAAGEVKSAILDLKSKGAESIVLDLRGNPGGLLYESVNVCNLFLPKGMEVVNTLGKVADWNKTYKTLNNPLDSTIPLAVLTNSGSASASEIVAGVMQDYDRGIIVGRRTFGKGLVQTTRPLAYNSQLKVTTAKYYTPSGRCIQAVDYSNRNPDGSVGKIPDSLKVAFKTSNGRTVFDGGGVTPDVETESEFLSAITLNLLQKGLLFGYATVYFYNHPEITDAKSFKLSSKEYNEFISWLEDKDYDYETKVEKSIKDLVYLAKQENYYSDIEEEISNLQSNIMHNKESDLITYQVQIKSILEEYISSRYYLVGGEIEASFDNDTDLQAAIEILNNPEKYKEILDPESE